MDSRSIATYDSLMKLASDLETNRGQITKIEDELSKRLEALEWRDEVANAFRGRYSQSIEQVNSKLIPILNSFIEHLRASAVIIKEYDPS